MAFIINHSNDYNTMTIAELITKLQTFPPQSQVVIRTPRSDDEDEWTTYSNPEDILLHYANADVVVIHHDNADSDIPAKGGSVPK